MKQIDWKQIIIKEGFKPFNRMKIGIDLDKTLTKYVCWKKEQCINANPLTEMVEFCWSAHNDTEYMPIVEITTARRTKLARETVEWLEKNNLPWAITFRKNPFDLYIGDEVINTKDVIKHIKGKKVIH